MWIYNTQTVGDRIRKQRKALDLTLDEMSEKIGKTPKFCADIERGNSGMFVETLLAVCDVLYMTPNLVLLGDASSREDSLQAIEIMPAQCTPSQRKRAADILRAFLKDPS